MKIFIAIILTAAIRVYPHSWVSKGSTKKTPKTGRLVVSQVRPIPDA